MLWPKLFSTRRERYSELSDSIREHLNEKIDALMESGLSRKDAERAARREFGNVTLIEERSREVWQWPAIELVLSDLKYAFRQLRRAPAFTATAVLTLAFGIGANLGVFQLLYSVILAELPVSHPEELMAVHVARTPFDQDWAVSYPAYQRLRAATPDIPLLASAGISRAGLEQSHHASRDVKFELVSENYFSVFGVVPAAGRLLTQADARRSQDEWPAVVRYDFARDTFGALGNAVGQHMLLNGRPIVVVGVSPKRFLGAIMGNAPDIWLPLEVQGSGGYWSGWDSLGPGHDVHLDKPWYNQPSIFWLSLIARVTTDRSAEAAAKWDQVFGPDRVLMTAATADPAVRSALLHATTELVPGSRGFGGMRKRFSVPLILLMALSGSIFAVCCLNLANLQLARLHARSHELGIRTALGAGRMRLIRQLVFEDTILVLLGGVSAFALGRSASEILVRWASSRNSLITIDLHPGIPIAVFGISLALLSLLSFSVFPAIAYMDANIGHSAGSRAKVIGIAQTSHERWRSNSLLIAQVSLSLVLSTMSACFAATLVHWETSDVGMDRRHILAVHVDMKLYGDHPGALPALFHQMQERLQAIPGVRGAAAQMCEGVHCGWITALYVHGRSGLTDAQAHGQEDHVSPGYFATVGVPVLRGRDFSYADTQKTQAVAILSSSYARKLFGNDDPVGQWIGYEPAPNDRKFLVIGEVADARVNGPQLDAPPVAYMDIDQNPATPHSLKIRTTGDPSELAPLVRDALRSVAPLMTVGEIAPYSLEMNSGLGTEKLLARLAGIYAAITLLLVAIGFYGVMSSRTARCRSEFGIRLALGASRRQILTLIVGQTARILLAGILPGIVLSIFAVRLAGHFLYGSVNAHSSAILAACFVLASAGSIAALIPARRAALTDPLESLRSE